jgi:hypothetical protein
VAVWECGALHVLEQREDSPSGTSSRPLSAMIVLVVARDYRRCSVVGGEVRGGADGGGDPLDTAAEVL